MRWFGMQHLAHLAYKAHRPLGWCRVPDYACIRQSWAGSVKSRPITLYHRINRTSATGTAKTSVVTRRLHPLKTRQRSKSSMHPSEPPTASGGAPATRSAPASSCVSCCKPGPWSRVVVISRRLGSTVANPPSHAPCSPSLSPPSLSPPYPAPAPAGAAALAHI